MRAYLFVIGAAFGFATAGVQAQQFDGVPMASPATTAQTCAQAYVQLDKALFDEARASGEPDRWVQYLVSQGCPRNKDSIRSLLMPLFGASAASEGDAVSVILSSGKFSGDQSQTVEKASNGQVLRSTAGGAHLYTFELRSRVNVSNIPDALYKVNNLPVPPSGDQKRNAALWVRYNCALGGQPYSGWHGDPGQGSNCVAANIVPQVFDRIQLELAGPYRHFFDISCRKNDGRLRCDEAGEYIYSVQVSLSRKPAYSSFLRLLTMGYVP